MMATALKRDDKAVNDLLDHINEHMTNPHSNDNGNNLINISSGVHASDDVAQSLLAAVDTGKNKMESFIQSSLDKDEEGNSKNIRRQFLESNSKNTTEDFADMKSKIHKTIGKKVSNLNPEVIFCCSLMIANVRDDVSFDMLMQYPIGNILASLFHDDGVFRNGQKDKLAKFLDKLQ